MSKILTKLGACSTKKKPIGLQFISETDKSILGGSYTVTGDGMEVSSEELNSTIEVGPSFKSSGCRLCGNKFAFRCNGCGRIVCYDGNAKKDYICPACGAKGNVPKAAGNIVPSSDAYPRVSGGVSPYNECAGKSNIPEAKIDKFGNPEGTQYDLAQDGSFKGYKIVILQLCHDYSAVINHCVAALKKKGFYVCVYNSSCPEASKLKRELIDACQIWIVSDSSRHLNDTQCKTIVDFYNEGHGLYLWGDNDPYYVDVNVISSLLFNVTLRGNYEGTKDLGLQSAPNQPGIVPNHLISTGIVSFYEGITISNISASNQIIPLVYSSDRKIVTGYHDSNGMRALIDGGFTRLFDEFWVKTAGTERFVTNCAAWLANIERFGYKQSKKI